MVLNGRLAGVEHHVEGAHAVVITAALNHFVRLIQMDEDARVASRYVFNVLRWWQLKDLDVVDLGAHNFEAELFVIPVMVAAALEIDDQLLGPDCSILDFCFRKFADIVGGIIFCSQRRGEVG